jgi:hypothetical protein
VLNVAENDIIPRYPNNPIHCEDNLDEENELKLISEAHQDIKGVIGVRHEQIQSKPAC